MRILSIVAQTCRNLIEADRLRLKLACLTSDSSIAEGVMQDCQEFAEESTLRYTDVFEHGAWAAETMMTLGTFSFAAWREHMRLWMRHL